MFQFLARPLACFGFGQRQAVNQPRTGPGTSDTRVMGAPRNGGTCGHGHDSVRHEFSKTPEHASDCAVNITKQEYGEALEHFEDLFHRMSAACSRQTDVWSTLQNIANIIATVLPASSISINVPTSSRQLVKIVTPLRSNSDELRPISEIPSLLDALQAANPILMVVAASGSGSGGALLPGAASCSYSLHMPLTFASVPQGTLLITTQGAAVEMQDHKCLASLLPLLSLYLYESGAVKLCDMLEKLQASSSVNALALNVTQELHKCFDWCHPEETEVRLVLLNPEQSAALVLARNTQAAEQADSLSLTSSNSSHWQHMSNGSILQPEPGEVELQGIQVPQANTLTHQCMLEGPKLRLVEVLSAMKASGQAWSDVFLGSALVMNPAWVLVAPVKVSDKQCGAILWLSSTRLNPELLLKAANSAVPPIAHAVSQCLQRVGIASSPNTATHLWSHALTQTPSRLGPASSRPVSSQTRQSGQALLPSRSPLSRDLSFSLPTDAGSIRCKVSKSDSASTLALMQTYQATISQHQRSAMSRTALGGDGGDDEIIEVISKAGQGTYGSVYVAMWKGLTVAVKVMRFQAEGRKAMRMAWELAVSNSLHHPNIVRVHAVLTDVTVDKVGHNIIRFRPSGRSQSLDMTTSGTSWESIAAPEDPDTSSRCHVLILEYCNRGSLNTFLADKYFMKAASPACWRSMSGSLGPTKPSSWQRDSHLASPTGSGLRRASSMTLPSSPLRPILPLLIDVASAMLYLHHHGFIHCDLKPENLLVMAAPGNSNGFVVKVADFGLTDMQTDHGPLMGDLGGTITHVAPEVVIHKKVTKACDVYSFGIIMFELYTCQRPYEDILRSKLTQAAQDKAIVGRLMKEELRPQFPPSAPPAYVQLARRCWAMDPSSRPTFAEVLSELKALLLPQEFKEAGSTAPEPAPSSCSGHRGQPGRGASGSGMHGASRLASHPVTVGWKLPAEELGPGRRVDGAEGAGLGCPSGPAHMTPPRRTRTTQCETTVGGGAPGHTRGAVATKDNE